VFENRVLRRIFGLKRDEVTGEWRKLHNEELREGPAKQLSASQDRFWSIELLAFVSYLAQKSLSPYKMADRTPGSGSHSMIDSRIVTDISCFDLALLHAAEKPQAVLLLKSPLLIPNLSQSSL
jgi:hypothetical protein